MVSQSNLSFQKRGIWISADVIHSKYAEGGLKGFRPDSFQKECHTDSNSPKEIRPQLLSKASVNFSNVK